MENFVEIINGIPYTGRLLMGIVFPLLIVYIIYNFISFFVSENPTKHFLNAKKMSLAMILAVLAELLICYTMIFHSNVEISGIDEFLKYAGTPPVHSNVRNNRDTSDSVSYVDGNQAITLNDEEVFIIKGADKLAVGDIISGEIYIKKINKTQNDIWYQYLLVPNGNVEGSIAVGSYQDIIVTSYCSDLGW